MAAAIHRLFVVGVVGADPLRKLYGQAFESPDLQLLMRHRAVMFRTVDGCGTRGVPAAGCR